MGVHTVVLRGPWNIGNVRPPVSLPHLGQRHHSAPVLEWRPPEGRWRFCRTPAGGGPSVYPHTRGPWKAEIAARPYFPDEKTEGS